MPEAFCPRVNFPWWSRGPAPATLGDCIVRCESWFLRFLHREGSLATSYQMSSGWTSPTPVRQETRIKFYPKYSFSFSNVKNTIALPFSYNIWPSSYQIQCRKYACSYLGIHIVNEKVCWWPIYHLFMLKNLRNKGVITIGRENCFQCLLGLYIISYVFFICI